ncbi:MAG: ABC transporter substrate-binding protein [Chloroflexota bacterium]
MPLAHRTRLLAASIVVAVLVLACGGGGGATPAGTTPSGTGAASGDASQPRVPLTVGLGYIPSVQFAPFYLAQTKGYYRDAGLDVTLQNKIDEALVPLVGQGAIDIGLADGTSVIAAVSQEQAPIPIRYVGTVYAKFPSIVFAKPTAGISTAENLKGRKIGIPGRYGSSWIMLQALLKSAGLTPSDVTVVEFPDFSQGAAVTQDRVDAATGFVNNEPVVLARQTGTQPVVLRVDQITPLPGNGFIAGVKTIESKGDALSGFIAATLRAMHEIIANPDAGLDASIASVPELASDRALQRAILLATIDTWQSPLTSKRGLGVIDREGWTKSVDYMRSLGLVGKPVTVDDLVQDDLLPGAD